MVNVIGNNKGSLLEAILYVGGACVPSKITSMLRLEEFTIIKIILFGIGTASILISISCMVGFMYINHFEIKPMNLGVIIGGLLFGIGFGSIVICPGTMVAATTSGGFK